MSRPDRAATTGGAAGPGGAADGAGGARSDTGGQAAAAGARWGKVFDGASGGRTPAECGAFADAVANDLATGGSVVMVRFDYRTRQPLGFAQASSHPECAFYAEKGARACAKADSSLKLPFDPTKHGTRLPARRSDYGPWVFYRPPTAGGGVIVLDDNFGTVFSASTPPRGKGEILVPARWSTKALGIGCSPIKNDGSPLDAFDLRSGRPMAEAESKPIARLAAETVLPGLWESRGGRYEVFLVLLYPRTMGVSDAQGAEYLVFMRGSSSGQ